MSQSGAGGQESTENAYTLLWILGGIFVVGILVWHFWGNYLKWFFIIVKRYEVMMLSAFFDTPQMTQIKQALNIVTPSMLTMKDAEIISDFIGGYLLYPASAILIILAITIFRSNAIMRYTKTYSIDSLVQQEKENWPQIAPVADMDLVEEDINTGPWAMCMSPMQFAKHHKLLALERVADRKALWRPEGVIKATLNREMALQVFASQIGPLWSDVNHLPPHAKALYAAFLARIEHDTESCTSYLKKLSASAARGALEYPDTETYLRKYGNSKPAKYCQTRHAYVLTVMASMLELARVDGVLASADFLWVKPLDRRLWYVLNSVGRQVAPAEVAGIYAHWIAEKQMGRSLTVPMVDEAVVGLEKALANMVYIPEEGENI